MRRSHRQPSTLKNLYIVLGFILAGLIVAFWYVNRNTVVKPIEITIASSPSEKGAVTIIYARSPQRMYIRGYYIPLTFDAASGATVKSIDYKLGTVSEGLGSDNSRLTSVNEDKRLLLQGESHEKDGTRMPTTQVPIAVIESTGKPTFKIQKEKALFYKINETNELIEVPVTVD